MRGDADPGAPMTVDASPRPRSPSSSPFTTPGRTSPSASSPSWRRRCRRASSRRSSSTTGRPTARARRWTPCGEASRTSASSTKRRRAGPAGRGTSGGRRDGGVHPVPRPRRPPRDRGRAAAVRPGRRRRIGRGARRSVGHGRPQQLPAELAHARARALRGRPRARRPPQAAQAAAAPVPRRATQIRFPEGKVRLEDQVFMLQAYFLARGSPSSATTSATTTGAARANAASTPWEPAFYYKYVRANLDVIERNTTPGPFRDRLLRRVASNEMLSRLTGKKFVAATPERRAALLEEIRAILEDYMPPDFDQQLIPPLRAVAGARPGGPPRPPRRARQGGGAGDPDGVAASVKWVDDAGCGSSSTWPSVGRQGDRHRAARAGRMATAGSRRRRRGHAVRARSTRRRRSAVSSSDGDRQGRRRHVARDSGRLLPAGPGEHRGPGDSVSKPSCRFAAVAASAMRRRGGSSSSCSCA